MKIRLNTFAFLATAALAIVAAGCSTAYETQSTRLPEHLRIDGSADDWQGHLLYYRDAKLTIGIANDSRFLSLCVMSSDENVYRSLMMKGFTVWFDTTGGKKKTFGIRYPLGMAESAPPEPESDQPHGHDEWMKRMTGETSKLALVGPGENDRTEVLLPGKNGLEARIGFTPGVFVVELKIPLDADIADGRMLRIPASNVLGVRFETVDVDLRKATGKTKPEEGMSDGSEGFGSQNGERQERAGGHRAGGSPRGTMQRPNAIDLFMKVQMASGKF